MATIQELHKNRGNPDLSHWKTRKMLSVTEAALLTCGFDPLEFDHLAEYPLCDDLKTKKPTNWQHVLMLINSIAEAVCTHEIKSPYVILEYPYDNDWRVEEQAKVSFSDEIFLRTTLTKIHRDELFKWLKKNGYFEQPQKNNMTVQHVTHHQIEPVTTTNVILLPELSYTTKPLEALHGVINEFWINYDPDKNQPPPKQDTVASWIRANYPDVQGKELCVYIDKICRHPTAKTGGNTKLNQSKNMKDITPKKQ
ncbi:hypothetical protein [Acinetobacter soli]|uniref:Uncharacterized protein n=1 Tax=Acinetobacter soli TaxID=487316 RepID=A0AB38YWE5_9GAMM|nr:hypothetical protein [Acinetobacter soli]WND05580.1 hypothetical protein RHP80_15625 [Acinetobacter soli]